MYYKFYSQDRHTEDRPNSLESVCLFWSFKNVECRPSSRHKTEDTVLCLLKTGLTWMQFKTPANYSSHSKTTGMASSKYPTENSYDNWFIASIHIIVLFSCRRKLKLIIFGKIKFLAVCLFQEIVEKWVQFAAVFQLKDEKKFFFHYHLYQRHMQIKIMWLSDTASLHILQNILDEFMCVLGIKLGFSY